MAFAFTWDATFISAPLDTEAANLGAGRIRDLKSAITERVSIDHSWAGDANDGAHKKVTLLQQAGDPTTAATTGFIYTKAVAGATEAFYKDAAGNVVQLTSGGAVVAVGATASTGDVKAGLYAVAPAGWLSCDGSAVSRTTYAALFGVLGTTFGAGDGATTFNLPDFRGRALIGNGTGTGLTARTIGQQTIGEEAHLLSTAEMPSHNHAITDPGHTHPSSAFSSPSSQIVAAGGTGVASQGSATGSATTGITVSNNGGGGTHNNMQPSAVVMWVVKT